MRRLGVGSALGLLCITTTMPAVAGPATVAARPWIAYADNAGISLIHPDGTDRHRLVAERGARYPSWSPNGRWLAYAQLSPASQVTAQTAIHVIRPNGTGDRIVTQGYEPSWLDSKWVLFHGDANIIGIRYDPGGFAKVNVETGDVEPVEIAHLTNSDYVGDGRGIPDYELSPDRRSIFWNGTSPVPPASPSSSSTETLKTVNLDGSGYQAVGVPDAATSSIGGWMPAGTAVTYPCLRTAAANPKTTADLCSIEPATGTLTDLSSRRPDSFTEEWSSPAPDGKRLVVGAAGGLYVVNVTGTGFRLLFRVSTPGANPTGPVWQS